VVIAVHSDFAYIISFEDQALTFERNAAALGEILATWTWS
jgi:hypothetical protein